MRGAAGRTPHNLGHCLRCPSPADDQTDDHTGKEIT